MVIGTGLGFQTGAAGSYSRWRCVWSRLCERWFWAVLKVGKKKCLDVL